MLSQLATVQSSIPSARLFGFGCFLWFFALAAVVPAADLRPEEIVTVLPKDAIPAILTPSFDEARKATWLEGKLYVVGVQIGTDSRAYPVPTLSRHEIVNDKVGGEPIAVTW